MGDNLTGTRNCHYDYNNCNGDEKLIDVKIGYLVMSNLTSRFQVSLNNFYSCAYSKARLCLSFGKAFIR